MDDFKANRELRVCEFVLNGIFSLEVVVRALCCPSRRMLLKDLYMWIDVLAVTPFYVVRCSSALPDDDPALELLTLLVPILRLLKITRHSSGWRLLIISLRMSLPQLTVPFLLLLLMVVFSSCVLFWIEKHCASEDPGPAFDSIPHSMWFTIATISTVGYGDVSPNSDFGKAATCGLILVGVCYMAMPLAIVGTNFTKVWADRNQFLIADKTKSKFSRNGVTPEILRKLFTETDKDGSGTISKDEFIAFLTDMNLGFTVAQIVRLFRTLDADKSGQVSFNEFHNFLFPELECDDDEDEDMMAAFSAVRSPIKRGAFLHASSPQAVALPAGSPTVLSSRRQSLPAGSALQTSPNGHDPISPGGSDASADRNEHRASLSLERRLARLETSLQGHIDRAIRGLREDILKEARSSPHTQAP
jgi:hypothetical protein